MGTKQSEPPAKTDVPQHRGTYNIIQQNGNHSVSTVHDIQSSHLMQSMELDTSDREIYSYGFESLEFIK